MSHISLLGATADYELHKSIHICKGIMFLCLLPSTLPGAESRGVGWRADTSKGIGDFSFKRAPEMSGGDGEVYKALGFQHLLMGGGPNMRIYPDGWRQDLI